MIGQDRQARPDEAPEVPDPYIFDAEVQVLEILEAADSPQEVNDRVVAIVRQLCEQVAALEEGGVFPSFNDTFLELFSFSDSRCRVCGCTQNRACVTDGVPCHWVEPDLCSACAADIETEQDRIYASWASKGGAS